jgi:hypothetical protein
MPAAILVRNLFCRGLCRIFVEVNGDYMRALFDETMRGFLANTRPCADNHMDLSRKLLLRGHPSEFCLFKQPVFNVECFLLRAAQCIRR